MSPRSLRAPVRRDWTVHGATSPAWHSGDPEAEPVILVHGFRGDHHGLERIAEHIDGRHVIVPDLPGFGAAEPFRAQHSIASYAEWLREFIAVVTDGRPYAVLGHSFGSIVVSAALASGLSPERVILVNPIASPALDGPRAVLTQLAIGYYRIAAALPETAGTAVLTNPAIVRVMSSIMAKTRDRELRSWIHAEHAAHFSRFANRDVVRDAFTASVSHTCLEYATAIHVPTLLIAAERDDISTVADQKILARTVPDARLRVLPDVGHLIHYEAPQRAAELITEFLGEEIAD